MNRVVACCQVRTRAAACLAVQAALDIVALLLGGLPEQAGMCDNAAAACTNSLIL